MKSAEPQEAIELTPEQFDLTKFNAVVTLTSPATGEHRTFRIRTSTGGKLAGTRVVELLVGPNNTNDYMGFATIGTDATPYVPVGKVRVWNAYRGRDGVRTQYERFVDLLARPVYWSGRGVRYQIAAACRRCNRPLTNPESLDNGYGPTCFGKLLGGE